MKKEFVFPMNYKKKERFLGIIDYKTLFVIILLSVGEFLLLRNLSLSIQIKIGIFIVTVGFVSILILVGVNGENMLEFFGFLIKFLVKEKVYLYRKEEND